MADYETKKFFEHPNDNYYQPVAEFYAGRSIFITGVTGFLGKVLLEKILYSCKDVNKVYVLLRNKKGLTVEQRIQKMFEQPVFSRLKNERPDNMKKVVPITGDINQNNLGISSDDRNIIQENVSVVFHVAANIKFMDKLNVLVNTNVIGTKQVLDLCKHIKNIKVFLYVSTAYSHTNQAVLEEKVYPPPAELKEVLRFLEQDCQDQDQTEKIINGWPNYYAFTKALAETYVAENHGNIPTVIIRPSIVCPSYKEPVAGWVDNWFGATGIATASVKGINRVIFGKSKNLLDLIPIDYVSNLAIVAASKCKRTNGVTVYNSCTSSCNPITIKKFFKGFTKTAKENNFHGFYPSVIYTQKKWVLHTLTLLLQTIPAQMADVCLRATGQHPRHVKIQSRVLAGRDALNFFTSHSWVMKSDRVKELYATLSPCDQQGFPCDPSNINWDEYTALYIKGVQRFLAN